MGGVRGPEATIPGNSQVLASLSAFGELHPIISGSLQIQSHKPGIKIISKITSYETSRYTFISLAMYTVHALISLPR